MSDSPQPAMPILPAVFRVSDAIAIVFVVQHFLTHNQAKFVLLVVVAPSFRDRLLYRNANMIWNKANCFATCIETLRRFPISM